MLATGKLKVASHLVSWFDEYLSYERGEDGKVIKRMDDLMSATRIGCMSLRYARVLEEAERPESGQSKMAKGLDFLGEKLFGGF